MGHEPLRITAHLASGVVSDAMLSIDGPLLAAAMSERYGPEIVTVPGELTDDLVDLPLARRGEGEAWYYAASWAQWPPDVTEGSAHWTKRISVSRSGLIDRGSQRGKIDTASGRYRGYYMPVWYRSCARVDWYVVGDADEIRRLLTRITALGKKRSQGWGAVRRWAVEPWPEDWSVTDGEGRLMRAVPVADGEDGVAVAIRPPAWLPAHQVRCRLP